MLFYPFNIREYRKDTMHLSVLEHGIYRLLLDTYYLEDGALKADECALMRRHCVRTPEEKEAFRAVIDEFFYLQNGAYHHGKCDEVIAEVMEKSAKAKTSAEKRWQKHNANAMRTHSEGNANGMLYKEKEKEKEIQSTAKSKISPCPVEQIIQLYENRCSRLPRLRVIPDKTRNAISARWRQDIKFQSMEFWQGFFDYCNDNRFLSGQAEPRAGGQKPFRADLNWIVKPESFANIINEKYA